MSRFQLLGIVLLTLKISSQVFGATQDDLTGVAEEFAPKIRTIVLEKADPDPPFQMAVFSIGDADGKITPQIAEPSQILQGELIFHLQMAFADGNSNVQVLSKADLKRLFDNSARPVSPEELIGSDPQKTADALQALGIDACIVGSFDATSNEQVAEQKNIRLSLTVIFSDATIRVVPGSVQANKAMEQVADNGPVINQNYPTIPDIATVPTGRLGVEILSASTNLPFELVTAKDPESEFYNVYFLVLPNEIKEAITNDDPSDDFMAEYKIRISNQGRPFTSIDVTRRGVIENPNDDARRFSVAVLVDGVNTIFEKDGYGNVGPVVRHPSTCSRWVLSGPGWAYLKNGSYGQVKGVGHSVIDIPGFQTGEEDAQKFVFSRAETSIAESVGITNDVGLISVYFFPEKVSGDITSLSSPSLGAGTRAGDPVNNPIQSVKLETYEHPCEVYRIFYRFEDELPIAEPDRIPVTYKE